MGKKKPRPLPESLGLPCVGVETHAHLDMDDFAEDFDEVFARAKRAGIARIGQVFLGPDLFEQNAPRFADRDEVFFLNGIHPHDATTCSDDALARMQTQFQSEPRLKALGEIGLDYFYDHSPRDVQGRAFADQLALAKDLDLPVVIHSRDAFAETLAILKDAGYHDRPLLWHCFGGDPAMAETILSHCWHISIPGPVTFPKNQPLRDAAAMIPLDKLMLESDCPYLTPAPYRGKRNEPAFNAFTAEAIAHCKARLPEDIWRTTAQNAIEFFGL